MKHDVADIGLADAGRLRIEWADRQMPVLAGIRERFAARAAARGLENQRLPARHRRDGEPDAHAGRRRSRCRSLLVEPALHAGRRGGVAGDALRDPGVRDQGRGPRLLLRAHRRGTRPPAADHHGRRRRPGERAAHQARRELLDGVVGGTEETTTGVIRLRAMANDGVLRVPDRGGQRGAHQAPVRQSLRHRAERDRRHPARDEHPVRRQDRGRRRLRLGRPRHRGACPRHGRQRGRRARSIRSGLSRRPWTASAS